LFHARHPDAILEAVCNVDLHHPQHYKMFLGVYYVVGYNDNLAVVDGSRHDEIEVTPRRNVLLGVM
jgi:hypothetical protein